MCGGTGRCGERTERCRWQRKRSERVAAVKILSVRRKAAQKFWAPQQDHRPLRVVCKKSVGRATARVAPTKVLQGVRWGTESPSHGFAMSAPFRQGGQGDGGCGLPRAPCALAMTGLARGAMVGGRTGASAPTDMWKRLRRAGLQEVRKNGPSGTPAPTEFFVGVDDPVRPGPDNATPCRAGPVCPAGGRGTEVTDSHTSDIGHWFGMTGAWVYRHADESHSLWSGSRLVKKTTFCFTDPASDRRP